MENNKKKLTTASGIPYVENENSMTVGPRGPILIQDFILHEKMAHFNRERIPERVVHAKGSGAYGAFTVTHDISKYTRAKLFNTIGKQTKVFVRFSTVGGEKGSADTERDPRGFAVKFYTEEGNWDLVGNNTPVFFVKDPKKFSDFIHTQKRDPYTNCKNATMLWDFWSLNPESLHQVTILMSDRGTPYGYRYMHGFGSHMDAANVKLPAKMFNDLGYATLRFDMRGCGHSEGTQGRLICLEQVEDTRHAIDYLLTRKEIDKVFFTVMGDRLLYVGPSEFVGAQPINLAFLTPGTRLEDLVVQTLNEHLFQLERRSKELTALGISPKVDAQTLQLTAELEKEPLKFVIGANRAGQFRVTRTTYKGAELTNSTSNIFELSEFFNRAALESYLYALFSDVVGPELGPATITKTPSGIVETPDDGSLSFREVFDAFGDAFLPPRSPLEVVADVRVGERAMRFAAARVQGRTFRGLLADASGKVWADRFEIDEFPGIRAFVSELLGVPFDEVEVGP